MQIDTPARDRLIADVEEMFDEWDELVNSVGLSEPKCFSHAQQLSDKERVKKLRRQQFGKGRRFK